MSFNKITIMGRLTRDPEMKRSQDGATQMARFSIAINRRFKNEVTDYFNCIAFGKTAEFVCKWFEKGRMIACVGSMQMNNYTDSIGNKRTTYDVNVDEVYFGGDKNETKNSPMDSVINQSEKQGFSTVVDGDDDLPF